MLVLIILLIVGSNAENSATPTSLEPSVDLNSANLNAVSPPVNLNNVSLSSISPLIDLNSASLSAVSPSIDLNGTSLSSSSAPVDINSASLSSTSVLIDSYSTSFSSIPPPIPVDLNGISLSSIAPTITPNVTGNLTIGPRKCENKFTDPGLPILCCNKPPLVSQEIVKSCSMLAGNCGFECVLNETGVFVNGHVNRTSAFEFARKGYKKESEWQNITIQGIDYCVKEAERLLPEINMKFNQSSINWINVCHPYAGFFVQCTFGHNFINCPKRKYMDNDVCNHFKNYLMNCHNSIEFF